MREISKRFWLYPFCFALFFLTSFLLTSRYSPATRFDLFLASGVFFCSFYASRTVSLIASLSFLAIGAFFFVSKQNLFLFEMGLTFSFFLSFLSFYLSFDQLFSFQENVELQRKQLLQKVQVLDEEIEKENAFHVQQTHILEQTIEENNESIALLENELASHTSLADSLRAQIQEKEKSYRHQLEENEHLQKQISIFQNEQNGKQIAVNEAQVKQIEQLLEKNKWLSSQMESHYSDLQNSILCHSEEKRHLEDTIATLQQFANTNQMEIATLKESLASFEDMKERYATLKEAEDQYKVLRRQFKEKDGQLRQTRKELFLINEKYLALNHSICLKNLDDDPYVVGLIKAQILLDEQLQSALCENEELYQIIDASMQKSPVKKKKSKQKLDELVLPI